MGDYILKQFPSDFYLSQMYIYIYTHIYANLENSAVAIRLEKVSLHSNLKEGQCQKCSNYHTIALTSHASKVRLQQYVN